MPVAGPQILAGTKKQGPEALFVAASGDLPYLNACKPV